mmetsp:Transcript_9499/g.17629  ORF Transcript_9499/g.17629 Transcript_9499/m.17629 type:complete len:1040 (-) Transcript_9499:113-3232(-)
MARRHRDYDESLSHEMSTLLRYKGPQRGLPMASDGFARFDDVATVLSRDPVRVARGNLEQEMLEVVRESSKKGNPRFHLASYFAPSSSECVRLIRATRKHAIEGLDHGRIAQNLDPIGLPPPALAELGAGRPRRSHRHQPHQAFYPRPGQPGAMPPSQHTAQDHFPHPGHPTEEVQGPFAHPPPPMEAAPPSSSEASNAQQSAAGSMGLGPPLRQAGHCEWYDLTADDPRRPATSPPSAVPLSEAVPGPPPGPPPGYEEQKAAEDDVDPELIRGPGLDPWFAGADPWQQQSAASSASSAMPVPITPPAARPPASPSVAAPPAPAQSVGPALPIAPASPVAPAPSMALPMYNIGPAPTAPPPAPPATPLAVAQPLALPSSALPPGQASAVPAASVVQLPAQPVSLAPPAAPAPAMAPVGANAANAASTVRVQMQQMQRMQQMQQMQEMYQLHQMQQMQQMQQLHQEDAQEQLHREQLQQAFQAAEAGNAFDAMQLPGFPGMPRETSFADAVHMQRNDMMQADMGSYAYATSSSAPPPGGHAENHALKAVAEALDRAEVNMLLGGRGQRLTHSPPRDDPLRGMGLHMGGDERHPLEAHDHYAVDRSQRFGGGGSQNFALQAAAEALGGRAAAPPPQFDSLAPPAFDARPAAVEQLMPRSSEQILAGMMEPPRHTERLSAMASPIQDQIVQEASNSDPRGPQVDKQPPAWESSWLPDEWQGGALNLPDGIQADVGRLSPGQLFNDDDDDELELMAQKEMDEDDIPGFELSNRLPPKPPKVEPSRPPSLPMPAHGHHVSQAQPQRDTRAARSEFRAPPPAPGPVHAAAPATVPAPPAAPAPAPPAGIKAYAPHRQQVRAELQAKMEAKLRYQKRDTLVDCILNDEKPPRPSRSLTPRGSRSSVHKSGRTTPRSTSRSAAFPGVRARTPERERSVTPRGSQVKPPITPRGAQNGGQRSSSMPAHELDILNISREEAGRRSARGVKQPPHLSVDSPQRSESSSNSSLPQLPGKLPGQRPSQTVIMMPGPPSARSWRDKAASLYAM